MTTLLTNPRTERVGWHAQGTVRRFRVSEIEEAMSEGALVVCEADEMLKLGIDPYSVSEFEHNVETIDGINAMLKLLIGAGGTTYANGNARLCVGDGGGTVPSVSNADHFLTATSNRYNQACDATYPSVSTNVLTAQATFPSGQANFEWREWAMDRGGASGSAAITSGDMFNHRGVDLGLKLSTAAWALSISITNT